MSTGAAYSDELLPGCHSCATHYPPAPSLGALHLHYVTWTSVPLRLIQSEQEKRRERSEGPGGETGDQGSKHLSFRCSDVTGSLGNPSPRQLWDTNQSVASPLGAFVPCPPPCPKRTKRQETASQCLSTSSSHVSQPSSGFQVGSGALGGKRAQWKADEQLDGESEGGPEKLPPSQVPVRHRERGCASQSSILCHPYAQEAESGTPLEQCLDTDQGVAGIRPRPQPAQRRERRWRSLPSDAEYNATRLSPQRHPARSAMYSPLLQVLESLGFFPGGTRSSSESESITTQLSDETGKTRET